MMAITNEFETDIKFSEKLCICYTCCGPTYRKSALDRLTNVYYSHPNLYYSILTDDKSYFKDVKLKNLVVHELKDYYNDYPYLEKYEWFLESTDEKDYAQKFLKLNYKFPFATYRFHLITAKEFGICNVALLSTDIKIHLNYITDKLFKEKNIIYSLVGWHPVDPTNIKSIDAAEIIKRKYNITIHENIMEFDEAARLYVFQDLKFMESFFNMWHDVVTTLYLEDKMWIAEGSYAVHDEFLLGVVCDALGIHPLPPLEDIHIWDLFYCYEISKTERFWTL